MCFCASGIKKGNFYMIRLVASDIDGTLLQGGARALSDELFGLIRVLKKRGIPVSYTHLTLPTIA